jgi:hypothetical protein
MGLLTTHLAMSRSCTITCSASVCHAILIHGRDYSTETFTRTANGAASIVLVLDLHVC